MANYAYLRVSTDNQDVDNQRHGILEYANSQSISGLIFVEDSVSSKVKWRERGCGLLLLETTQPGDTIVFGEISRMARSTLQVLEMLEVCIEREINVHIAKQKMILDGSMQSKITATVLGLAAEIEREFIRMRTTESLNARKKLIEEQGFFISKAGNKVTRLGRPSGETAHTKLDDQKYKIMEYLDKGINKRAIAKLLDCAPGTLYSYLEKNGLHTPKKTKLTAH